DRFIDHDKPDLQYEAAGLRASHIVATALGALGRDARIAKPSVAKPSRA
ncbi:MAG: hypothetical protein IIC04_07085, partial [Proteobacteria bacterium]|nr:hypothetical protein [Pseudomonadota bacterium]